MPEAIERAIDAVEQREQEGQLRIPLIEIPVLPREARVTKHDARLQLHVPDHPLVEEQPWLLVFEPSVNAWRAVYLPRGSEWELAAPRPKIYLP